MTTLVHPAHPAPPLSSSTSSTHPYTCLSCGLAFTTAQTQRSHYSTDLHRYNSKRSIAGLTPIDLETFDRKFNHHPIPSDRPHPLDLPSSPDHPNHIQHRQTAFKCDPCHKTFNSRGAHTNHLISKRHKEIIKSNQSTDHPMDDDNPLKNPSSPPTNTKDGPDSKESIDQDTKQRNIPPSSSKDTEPNSKAELERIIKLRYERAPKIASNECLFCPRSDSIKFPNEDQALSHMLNSHGFFLPDQEYLVDRVGLLNYLAESISVWNVCLYCSIGFGGKIQSDHSPEDHTLLTRRGLESVRKHMCDKNHCKLPWDTEEQRLEYSDFFDYRPSYQKRETRPQAKLKRSINGKKFESIVDEDEWEDVSVCDSGESMEVDEKEDDQESLPDTRSMVDLGNSPFELILSNGVRLGHRSLKYIYKQKLLPYSIGSQSTQAGNRNINMITRLAILSLNSTAGSKEEGDDDDRIGTQSKLLTQGLLKSKTKAINSKRSLIDASLIPSRGAGLDLSSNQTRKDLDLSRLMIKARNPGEAKHAGQHVRKFNDVRAQQNFRNRVACTSGNNQKHYRDPLLQ